jgi:hypothetical protein
VLIRTVPAVDGKPVPVSATMSKEGSSKLTEAIVVAVICCILGLLIKGGKTSIPEGATVQASVLTPTVVEVP